MKKNKFVAAILAIFLGSFGIHKFYLGQTGKGVLYLLFFWTIIPGIIGIIEGIGYLLKSDEDFNAMFSTSTVTENSPFKYILNGVNGRLTVYENKIELSHKGALGVLSHGFSGDKTIPIKAIQTVQMKEGGALVNGYLQFGMFGAIDKQGGIDGAINDENAIVFTAGNNKLAKEIKAFIEEKIYNSSSNQPIVNNVSSADEILKLKQLLDSGVITQEEFDKKKSQLLS